MTTDFARPAGTGAQEPRRDRWGRPLVAPPDGGEPIAYTRVSTLAKCIEDTSNLSKWMQRMVAVGIGKRPDLQALAGVLDPDKDKSKLNELCEQAMTSAKSGQAANLGTTLHAYTEWVDTPGADSAALIGSMAPDLQRHVRNYVAARDTRGLQVMAMERFVVNDELQAAGSFDRLYFDPQHAIVVGDTKTGETAPQYPHSIAMQVAIYAHSQLYDIETGARTPIPGVNLEVGLLVHLNQKTGQCDLYSLDLVAGWKAAQLAAEVHAWRKQKGLVTAL